MPYDYDEIVNGLVDTRGVPVVYNYVDFNRVEYATEAMAALVSNEGYYVTISTKTDWNGTTVTAANFPTKQNILRYWGNIVKIRENFPASGGLELPESIYAWDYTDANQLERFLKRIPALVADMVAKYRRCNTFRCGQEV